ncbi:hypothetical protein E2C01_092562 [Portunus trituberculatus]|uniref:Uncharacterized protein n=1 Tax=Portunus trituberculatus TaxID=210409 RepID=A0A5B7JW47_PORTR|nr:hypothetical protein [Portunus trituberculatus]
MGVEGSEIGCGVALGGEESSGNRQGAVAGSQSVGGCGGEWRLRGAGLASLTRLLGLPPSGNSLLGPLSTRRPSCIVSVIVTEARRVAVLCSGVRVWVTGAVRQNIPWRREASSVWPAVRQAAREVTSVVVEAECSARQPSSYALPPQAPYPGLAPPQPPPVSVTAPRLTREEHLSPRSLSAPTALTQRRHRD